MSAAVVTRLGWTAVKGMHHHSHPAAEFAAGGVVGDRVFAIVDPAQRTVLRTIQWPYLIGFRASWHDDHLTLTAPDGSSVSGVPDDTGEVIEADYWGRTEALALQSGQFSGWLSQQLGHRVELARARPCGVIYAGPVSLVTTGELAQLQQRLDGDTSVDERAFRANVTLDLDAELQPAQRWRIGSAVVLIGRPITRCAIVNRDPDSGEPGPNLLQVLGTYRRRAATNPGSAIQQPDEIQCGVDATVLAPGRVRVGDRAELLA